MVILLNRNRSSTYLFVETCSDAKYLHSENGGVDDRGRLIVDS